MQPTVFLWVLKSRIFPDSSWEEKTGLAYGLVIWLGYVCTGGPLADYL